MEDEDIFAEPTPEIAPASPDTTSDAALFRRLGNLVIEGKVRLRIDKRKVDHIDFPLNYEADGNHFAFPLLILSGAIWWWFGIRFGVAAFVISFILYQTLGRAYVAHRLKQRILTKGFTDLDTWRKVWRFGGVSLVAEPAGTVAQGPEASWTQFVRQLDTPQI